MITSIQFPHLFKGNSVRYVTGNDATLQNLKLLLLSEQGDLYGDPEFGIKLKRYMYDQNNNILKSILIEEIYTKIATFMPQLIVDRRDIRITRDRFKKSKCFISITARNRNDYTLNTYNLQLFEGETR